MAAARYRVAGVFTAVLECDDVEVGGFVVCRRGGAPYPLTPGLVEGVVRGRGGVRVLYRVSPLDLWPLRRLVVDEGDPVASALPNPVVNVDVEPSGEPIPAGELGIVSASRVAVARREYVLVEGVYVVGGRLYSGRLFLGLRSSGLVAYGEGEVVGGVRGGCRALRAVAPRLRWVEPPWLSALRRLVEGAGGVLEVTPVYGPSVWDTAGVSIRVELVARFDGVPPRRVRSVLRSLGFRYWGGEEREWRAVVVVLRDYLGCLSATRWD